MPPTANGTARTDVQTNAGTTTLPGNEGIVYDPASDPHYPSAASLQYPTGSTLVTNSIIARDYGPQTLWRLYVSRGTTTSNTITIKSGDLVIEDAPILGRSGSTMEQQNLGRIVQTGGSVRIPLAGLDLGQREASTGSTPGWGNGVYEYHGGILEVSEEGTGALRLSAGSTTANVGAGGRGTFVMHNPASGGHVRAYNVMSAAFAGVTDSTFDPLMDPDGVNFGVGVFEFHLENGGTRPFQVINNLSLNNGLDSTTQGTRSSRLDLQLTNAPAVSGGVPQNLALFDVDSDNNGGGLVQGVGTFGGTFSSADGATNFAENSIVSATFGSTKYNWKISYSGNIAYSDQENSVVSSITGATTGRDIVLIGFSTESAGLPGDFNANGVVDAADYTIWRNNLGGSSSALNGNGSGGATVVQADYDLWKTKFGTHAGSGSLAASAVPEPTAVLLGMVGALLAAVSVRRRSA